MSNYIVIRLLL